MRLGTFEDDAGTRFPGVVHDDVVHRLDAPDLITVLAADRPVAQLESHALSHLRVLAPIPDPPSIRDFFVFEQHVATARGRRGLTVPEFWYREPVFYFTNPAAVIGPGDGVVRPEGTRELDYELEVAAVIGRGGAIAGFTIMNDWSARDIQREETTVGLGPAKAKDFATTLGPWIVTTDEFDGTAGTMTATVNGVEYSRGELASAHYGWDAILERASRSTRLRPGDVLGSGTVGTGCILELGTGAWLQPGDRVELRVEGIGSVENDILTAPRAGG